MISRRLVTTALAALLTSATGKPVGRGRLPDAKPPYYLLYYIDMTLSGAPFADMNEDASFVYQVTNVSGPDPDVPGSYGTQDQEEWLADKAREAVLGRDPATGLWLHTLTVPGARCISRSLEIEPGESSDPTDAIISSVQRFRLNLTST
ncbi:MULTISPECIES: hypothetical protein [unclassified Streptomyces]|uniref:hypothetical protein n=1 Tax=unclassified Streptomyces TaxID=2593676 RepID=UPI0033DB3A99